MKTNKYKAVLEAGKFYHVFNRSINGVPIFFTDRNRRFFLKRYRDFLSNYLETWAWVLMGNHFHMAIRVKDIDSEFVSAAKLEGTVKSKVFCKDENMAPFLEDQFKRLFSSYAQGFNKEHSRTGSLFQKGFRRRLVEGEQQLLQLIHYVHNNPVHHGFVKHPRDWFYSSYGTILSDRETTLEREAVIRLFGNDVSDFTRIHDQVIEYNKSWMIE